MSKLIIFAGQTFSDEEIERYNKTVAAPDRLVIRRGLPFFQHEIDEHKAGLEKDVREGFMSKELAAHWLKQGPFIARFPRPDPEEEEKPILANGHYRINRTARRKLIEEQKKILQ